MRNRQKKVTTKADDQPEEQVDPECEDAEAEVQEEDAANLAEVLTVTARKLANVTQGRKYSGQPKEHPGEETDFDVCSLWHQRPLGW